MATIQELTTGQLKQALRIREEIESLQHQLAGILGGAAPKIKLGRPAGKKKRTMSPATIAKMRAAQQARWAHLKATPAKKSAPAKASVAKKKGGMSPEAKAKIAAAMKARWAAKRKDSPAAT